MRYQTTAWLYFTGAGGAAGIIYHAYLGMVPPLRSGAHRGRDTDVQRMLIGRGEEDESLLRTAAEIYPWNTEAVSQMR